MFDAGTETYVEIPSDKRPFDRPVDEGREITDR